MLLSKSFINTYKIFLFKTNECGLHKFFISFNMILAIIVSVSSIHPKVQEHHNRLGLLQVKEELAD